MLEIIDAQYGIFCAKPKGEKPQLRDWATHGILMENWPEVGEKSTITVNFSGVGWRALGILYLEKWSGWKLQSSDDPQTAGRLEEMPVKPVESYGTNVMFWREKVLGRRGSLTCQGDIQWGRDRHAMQIEHTWGVLLRGGSGGKEGREKEKGGLKLFPESQKGFKKIFESKKGIEYKEKRRRIIERTHKRDKVKQAGTPPIAQKPQGYLESEGLSTQLLGGRQQNWQCMGSGINKE